MMLNKRQRVGAERPGLRQRFGLQREAFGGVSVADSCRLHVLQMLERDRQPVGLELDFFGEELEQLLERGREVTVLVERIDERRYDLAIAQWKIEQRELGVQVIAQRVRRHLLRQEGLVIVVASARGRAPI